MAFFFKADTIEPADSKVHVLNYRNFDRFVKRNPLILMEFYAPWCGHCQQLAPQYREAAKKLASADLAEGIKTSLDQADLSLRQQIYANSKIDAVIDHECAKKIKKRVKENKRLVSKIKRFMKKQITFTKFLLDSSFRMDVARTWWTYSLAGRASLIGLHWIACVEHQRKKKKKKERKKTEELIYISTQTRQQVHSVVLMVLQLYWLH